MEGAVDIIDGSEKQTCDAHIKHGELAKVLA